MIYQCLFRSFTNPTTVFLLVSVLVCVLVKFIDSWFSIKGDRLQEMQTFGVIHVNNDNRKRERTCKSYQASMPLDHWDGPTGVQR